MKKDIIIVIGILVLLGMSIFEIGIDIKRNIDYELQHGTVITEGVNNDRTRSEN